MKSLQLVEAAQRCVSSLSNRLLVTVLSSAILSTSVLAAEGENVRLAWSSTDRLLLIAAAILGFIGIVVALVFRASVIKNDTGTPEMLEVSTAIEDGALAYLKQQIRMMMPFVGLLAFGLWFLYRGLDVGALLVAAAFIIGVVSSYGAGYVGMMMAVRANVRVAAAALTSNRKALEIAFHSGSVAGLMTVGVGLLCSCLILILFPAYATMLLVGYGFGGSLAALFMRVGGGIFTKAADVGADLVGKVEANIPEDSAMNPATIADNVGDNVGDCAGMAADVFESYEVMLVAIIILGAATASVLDAQTWPKLIVFALVACGIGILASILGIATVKGSDDLDVDPLNPILRGFRVTALLSVVGSAVLAYFLLNDVRVLEYSDARTYSFKQANIIQDVMTDVAKKQSLFKFDGSYDYSKLKEADVMNDPRVKDLPLMKQAIEAGQPDAKTQLFNAVLEQRKSKGAFEAKPFTGFSRLSTEDIATSKLKSLDYAMPDPTMAPGPEAQFVSIRDAFSGKTVEQNLYFQEFVQKLVMPAANGQPAVRREQPLWIGPSTKAQIKAQIENMQSQARSQPGVQLELIPKKTVTGTLFYKAETNEFAVFASDEADPSRLSPAAGLGFYEASVAEARENAAKAKADPKTKPLPLKQFVIGSAVLVAKAPWYLFAAMVAMGAVLAVIIEGLTNYYVSTTKRPTKEVAGIATAGPAPMIIQGFAYGCESSVFMVLAIVGTLMVPLMVFSAAVYGSLILAFYGIALVGLGLLTTTGYILAMDTFGPISDNAQGVFEMGGQSENAYGSRSLQRLDAAGNTTKALTKGFAIATAVVAAVALFQSFIESAHLQNFGLRLDVPHIFLGLMIGAAAPFLFSSFTINAVGRAAFELISEVRRQFKENPGILKGEVKPDYARCVSLVTAAAQRELVGPGVLAIMLPIAVGFAFSIGTAPVQVGVLQLNLAGAQALGGFLAGAIASGQLMAVMLSNSGGMWDNAKKAIEDGLHGGKGTEEHKAAVVCDTVGDPFKDTAGPALNPLIKVMNLVALLIVGVVVQPASSGVLGIGMTVVSGAALVWAFMRSKKGSLSESMSQLK